MFDYKSGSPPEEKDLLDLAVDWFDADPVRWIILADWILFLAIPALVFVVTS